MDYRAHFNLMATIPLISPQVDSSLCHTMNFEIFQTVAEQNQGVGADMCPVVPLCSPWKESD